MIQLTVLAAMTIGLLTACQTVEYNYFVDSPMTEFEASDEVFTHGFGTDNNGAEKSGGNVEYLTSIKPSDRQLAFQDMGYYNFIHFGMNTFTGNEWGDGKTSPQEFDPSNLSTDQWCEVLKSSGSTGIIFTAKHHDGFCLWPSAYTDYDIAASPYKNGTGDIVAELSASCAKYGLKLGIYLSPWDMHEPTYGKAGYNEFFLNQLRELLSNYGEIFSVWFDGARGEDAVIDKGWDYDWGAYYDLIRQLQPNAVINVMGPDVRWCGNELGIANENEWCITTGSATDTEEIAAKSQHTINTTVTGERNEHNASALDMRKAQLEAKKLIWYPSEVDVSIRDGWFYHRRQSPKPLQHLLYIYYKSTGNNSSLLLNVPPDKSGRICSADEKRLREFGAVLAENKAKPIDFVASVGNCSAMSANNGIAVIKSGTSAYAFSDTDYLVDLDFSQPATVKLIELKEDLSKSQRVELFDVYLKMANGKYVLVARSNMIGANKMLLLDPEKMPPAVGVRIVFLQSRGNPVIRNIGVFG